MSLCPCLVPVLSACALLGALSFPAQAGPWPRDAGRSFIALTGEHDRASNSHAGFYAEYGLARRRTLGLEISHTDVGETSAMVWFQKPLDGGEGPNKLSYSMGIGATRREGQLTPMSQVALM